MRIATLTLLLCLSCVAAWAGPGVMMGGKLTHGRVTLNSNGTYSKSGPAVVTYVNPHFTVSLPGSVTSVSVEAAGAAGGNYGTGGAGKGCIVSATVPVSAAATLTAKIGVKPADNSITGGYGGGRGHDGYGAFNQMGGGGSTSLADGTSILIEAGAGGGGSSGGSGVDAIGDGGGVQDATHGNMPGASTSQGGGWSLSSVNPIWASSRIVPPATGTYAIGASGNAGSGYMTITY